MSDRNLYDYNHATQGTHFAVTIIVIMIVMCVLGGLFIGLSVLDHL